MKQTASNISGAEGPGLPVGSELLNGQFLVRAQLQSGGFAQTYIARDSLARQVVVKECFPSDLCVRTDGVVHPITARAAPQFDAVKAQFIREARQLAKLVHPNIVAVHQVFEENNTAYMALDHLQGCDLFTLADEQSQRITNDFLLTILNQCLIAIGFIHERALLHRDISPDNMMVDENSNLTLIDFGAAHERSKVEKSPLFAVKDGYSPYEFYIPKGRHDFSSDLYALGATFYYLITGSAPPDAMSRLMALTNGQPDPYQPLASGAWPYDHKILATIDRALKMRQANRFQSVKDWVAAFHATPQDKPAPAPEPKFNPDLENEIARIVEHTNTQLEEVQSQPSAHAACQTEEMATPKPAPPPLVDIFGQPVQDIAAWQEEQERDIQQRQDARRAAAEAEHAQTDEGKSAQVGILSGLISRCIPKIHQKKSRRSHGAA